MGDTSSTPTTDVATDRRGHHLNLIWSLVSKAVLPPILPLDLMCNLVVFKRIIYVLASASSGHAYPQYCTETTLIFLYELEDHFRLPAIDSIYGVVFLIVYLLYLFLNVCKQ